MSELDAPHRKTDLPTHQHQHAAHIDSRDDLHPSIRGIGHHHYPREVVEPCEDAHEGSKCEHLES